MYFTSQHTKGISRLAILLVSSVFLLLFCSQLVEKSMFIDGVWYAGISRNMMLGLGEFWYPQFSSTIFSQFHEHPPLVFGLQSIFFQLLGDQFMTERWFMLLHYLLTVGLIIALWRVCYSAEQKAMRRLWFLPVLLWQVNIVNYFYLPANVLDTTLSLFDLAAILFLFKSIKAARPIFYIAGAAALLVLAVLSKGFTGLFPLAFFGIYALVFRKSSLPKVVGQTFTLLSFVLLFLTSLFLVFPMAYQSLAQYLEVQVVASLSGARRTYHFRENRLFIIGQLLMALIPMGIALIGAQLYHWFRLGKQPKAVQHRYAWCFLLIGLSASLPLVISPRQALVYLLPSIPYFSLAFAIWAAPAASILFKQICQRKPIYQLSQIALLLLCAGGFLFTFNNYGQINQRDQIVISDAEQIANYLGKEKVLSSKVYNMYISGYLMRDYQISLDTVKMDYPFMLCNLEQKVDNSYQKINLATQQYVLYQKKNMLHLSLDNEKSNQ